MNNFDIKGPTFLLVGAGKAGSTSLYGALTAHGDIFGCEPKEPMFFTVNYNKGLQWYASLFADGQLHKHRFEASPQYTFVDEFPEVVQRIAKYNHYMKIIYVVRDPLLRIVSHFTHWSRTKPHIYRDINECLVDSYLRLPLVERTKYWKQIEPYLETFGENNCKIVFLEDYVSDHGHTMEEVFKFLGLKASNHDFIHSNSSNKKERSEVISSLKVELRNVILREIQPDSMRLLEYCGKERSYWKCYEAL